MATELHPSPLELEAHHVGEGPPVVASHLAGCGVCRGYVAELESEAARFAAAADPEAFLRKVHLRDANTKAGKWSRRRLAEAALASAAGLLLLAPMGTTLVKSLHAPSASGSADQLTMKGPKGPVQLTVVISRDERQSWHTGQVPARTGDRFRVELALTRAAELEVVIVDDRNTTTVVSPPRRFEPGRHLLASTFRVTNEGDRTRVLAGPPQGVRRAVAGYHSPEVAELIIMRTPSK